MKKSHGILIAPGSPSLWLHASLECLQRPEMNIILESDSQVAISCSMGKIVIPKRILIWLIVLDP